VQLIAGGALLLVAGTFRGELAGFSLAAVTLRSWIAYGYLIVFGGIGGMTAFLWLMRVTTPARASTYAYVNPIVAVVLGWAYAGEPLSGRTAAAAAIIVAGVALVISFRDRQPRSASAQMATPAEVSARVRPAVLPLKPDSATAPLPVACDGDEAG
jgi:drug/metabolite transporter (DMT)-like permease